jgi:hypothetical protein
MPKFNITVEKCMYCTGSITVSAKSWWYAIKQVRKRISSGKLQTTDIEWGDPKYEDSSFDATGDVDEI